MAKQIKEIEVAFPDCDICGRDIGTEEYLDLVTVVSKRRHADDGSEFPPRFNDHCSLSICKRCISHPEDAKARGRAWRDSHPEQVKESHNQESRKGGKYYEKMLVAQRTGIPGEKNRIRTNHCREYKPYKDIIAPDSQIHHEWIPLSYEYRGLALVEAKPHQYGIIDVIQILDGTITLLTEEDVKNGKKKQDDTL